MDRDAFLAEIAQRLGRPRPIAMPARQFDPRPALPLIEDPLHVRFKHELERVGGHVSLATSLAEVHALVRAELCGLQVRSAVSWAASEFAEWQLDALLAEQQVVAAGGGATLSDEHSFRQDALAADLGLTCVDAAIADTGTLLLSTGPGRPRSASLLPRVHLALVAAHQLVPNLSAALRGAHSTLVRAASAYLITGPSRTSDIENDLTIGVHGPAAMRVIVWSGEPS